ncbi:hypothetical protein Salat_2029200 [Sesamum alatum]|uniref:Uncharacterized protein n=1 Tax=Sesamum alatum TaxID=300844 RepID=A0AAE1XZH7_9LAMI|nr:hypothetical protein Salat_2029200 [Sesamum alatum]
MVDVRLMYESRPSGVVWFRDAHGDAIGMSGEIKGCSLFLEVHSVWLRPDFDSPENGQQWSWMSYHLNAIRERWRLVLLAASCDPVSCRYYYSRMGCQPTIWCLLFYGFGGVTITVVPVDNLVLFGRSGESGLSYYALLNFRIGPDCA